MHITMVKKRLANGAECLKCQETTAYLRNRGLWPMIDEVVWALEDDAASPGMVLGARLGVERAPFFIVRDEQGETVYASVLQLISERLGSRVTTTERAAAIDVDDIGGI